MDPAEQFFFCLFVFLSIALQFNSNSNESPKISYLTGLKHNYFIL